MAGDCANGIRTGLELEEPNQHEEVLPYPGRRGSACRFHGGCAGTRNGKALAWTWTGLPHHREEEGRLASWPPQGNCRESTTLPSLVSGSNWVIPTGQRRGTSLGRYLQGLRDTSQAYFMAVPAKAAALNDARAFLPSIESFSALKRVGLPED
jgi:hypothetical protein